MKTIEDIIYEYLDNEFEIEGNVVFMKLYQDKFFSSRDDWNDDIWEPSSWRLRMLNRKKVNYTNSVSQDIIEMFGVEDKEYFWNWAEDRIGKYCKIGLDFEDRVIEYSKRRAGDTYYCERHYTTYLDGPDLDEDDEDYEYYYDDYGEQDEPLEDEDYERYYRKNRHNEKD